MKATYFGGQNHRYLYLNEALCGMVGRHVGVRVPALAAVDLRLEQAHVYKPDAVTSDCVLFGSALLDPCEPLTPDSANGAPVSEIAGMVVFDALVWNTDRKHEHVLAQQRDGGWQLWAVDHGHCLAVADSLTSLPAEEETFSVVQDLLNRLSRQDVDPWIAAFRDVSKEEFQTMVEDLPTEWIVEPDAPERLAAALCKRAEALEKVVYVHVP